MAIKPKEQQLQEAKERRDKLLAKKNQLIVSIRKEEDMIKRLESAIKEEKTKAVIKRIEVSGVDLEVLLDELERKAGAVEE